MEIAALIPGPVSQQRSEAIRELARRKLQEAYKWGYGHEALADIIYEAVLALGKDTCPRCQAQDLTTDSVSHEDVVTWLEKPKMTTDSIQHQAELDRRHEEKGDRCP